MRANNSKKSDIIFLIIFPLISVAMSLIFKTNYLVSTLLFFGLPALWLSYRKPKMITRTALFSFLFVIPLGIVVDYIVTIDDGWLVPETSFPFRLFGMVPIEDLIYVFLLAYGTILFYEHFLEKKKHSLIDKKMNYFVWLVVIIFILFLIILSKNPSALHIKYAYLWSGLIVLLLPAMSALAIFPKHFANYVKTASYFFVVTILFEFTALELGQWDYIGNHFIGWVRLFGYQFPVEEFIFALILFSIGTLSLYDFFDEKHA